MERAIIHSDLIKKEIHPSALLKEYLSLLKEDIRKLLPASLLLKESFSMTGEKDVIQIFTKMGMKYQVSQPHGNIFISLRPSLKVLMNFYLKSEARRFWLTELWPKTQEVRLGKIILPQLMWSQGFITQYASGKKLNLMEFFPNHWGYSMAAKNVFPEANYKMIDSLFDSTSSKGEVTFLDIVDTVGDNSLDTAFLFEALDRSPDPTVLLDRVKHALRPGGLCFITCLLSSGFEVQMLSTESDLFVPPERMNLFSFEGMLDLVKQTGGLDVLEFSTPGVLDIPNVMKRLDRIENSTFFNYILTLRQDPVLIESFQDFLQLNRLGTFGRLVLRKL
jgi:hypothetical protein